MAQLVYIDETGSVGKGARRQWILQLVAVVVDETAVQPLVRRMREVADEYLDELPVRFEFHGNELWNGKGPVMLIAHLEIAEHFSRYSSGV